MSPIRVNILRKKQKYFEGLLDQIAESEAFPLGVVDGISDVHVLVLEHVEPWGIKSLHG